jgi:hypothetical protein
LGLLIVGTLTKKDKLRASLIRYSGIWIIPAGFLLLVGGAWWTAKVPGSARALFMGGAPLMTFFFALSCVLVLLVVFFTFFSSFVQPGRLTFFFPLLLLVLLFLAVGAWETVREGVRKPYIIRGYMYSNGILQEEVEQIKEKGFLATKGRWLLQDKRWSDTGEALFQGQCRMCHEMEGTNAMKPLLKGWERKDMESLLKRLHVVKSVMPPFAGTAEERAELARWLHETVNREEEE